MASRDEEIIRLAQGEHTDAVKALEESAARRALGDLEARFTALAREAIRLWVAAFGGPRAKPADAAALERLLGTVRAATGRLLDGLGARSAAALREVLTPAVRLGVGQAAQVLGLLSGGRVAAVKAALSEALRSAPGVLPGLVEEQRRGALAMLKAKLVNALGLPGVLAGVRRAAAVTSRIESHISQTVNEAVNDGGLQQIVAHAPSKKVWVAEREACVTCAAYAGLVVDVAADFPGGLSWDPNQRGRTEPIPYPPRHPHCRCRVLPWDGDWAELGVPSMPEVLRREAERSIARGWSRPTESNAARIRAARQLLRTGSRLPRSVQRAAAEAVAAGRFPSRNVPSPDRVAA